MVTVVGSFWDKKLMSFQKRLNVKNDAHLYKQDYSDMADRINVLSNNSGLRAKQIKFKTIKLWYFYFGKDSTNDGIDAEKFLVAVRDRKDALFPHALLFMDTWYDAVDRDASGFIDKDQYADFLNTYGNGKIDKAAGYECFKKVDLDGDGKLSFDDFVQFGIDYFTTNEEHHPSASILGPLI